MDNKQRKGDNTKSLSSSSELIISTPNVASSIGNDAEQSETISRKTPAIIRNPDGSICIGSDCTVIRVPPPKSGKDIEIDFRGCDKDTQDAIDDAIKSGSGADFKFGKLKK